MSGSTIRDELENGINNDSVRGNDPDFDYDAVSDNTSVKSGIDFKRLLLAQTGEGSIEDYIHHPLNISENKNMARILRGLTGMFGELSLAIIDIGVGMLDFFKGSKPKKVVNQNDNSTITGLY